MSGTVLSYHELIHAATLVPPGDTHAANGWLLKLAAVLEAGELMPSQRSYLYRLRRTWRVRAAGKDARWNVHGSRAGARPKPPTPGAPVPVASLRRPAAPATPAPPARLATEPVAAPRAEPAPMPGPPVDPPRPVAPVAPAPALSSLLDKYA